MAKAITTVGEDRYARQTVLPEIGKEGQARLAAARVVIVGCGGLGSPAAAYLAGSGVGALRLVDGDRPESTNLHRQVFYADGAEGDKVTQLQAHLQRLNPSVKISAVAKHLTAANARALLTGAHLVLDCTDDARTKHLLNDACVHLGVPLLYAAAQGYSGYLALFENKPGGINLRDLYPSPDPSLPDCATAGVLPTAVGVIALLQANAALCYLLEIGDPPIDRLLTYHALDNTQHRIKLQKTYQEEIPAPWATNNGETDRAALEVASDTLTPPGYDGIFSMLSETREPELPAGVQRLDQRNPLGQCLEVMEEGGKYLLYCNSGKLSLVLAAQIKKERPGVEVVSLRGGIKGL
ncbi:adenylyltransferase/sulfurtransferase [Lewinella marina]|uniref:HesA/MoeB/ThiF family protein n=1 Tax=Neolewinella marina TaxID=438751 RepID=UPI001430563C|nr:HesA/MoeB/ThiF family protein [Neolewinella marina]NJB85035.1 adenylyltransferase/sulfurtransferase [Neolewinella marina]